MATFNASTVEREVLAKISNVIEGNSNDTYIALVGNDKKDYFNLRRSFPRFEYDDTLKTIFLTQANQVSLAYVFNFFNLDANAEEVFDCLLLLARFEYYNKTNVTLGNVQDIKDVLNAIISQGERIYHAKSIHLKLSKFIIDEVLNIDKVIEFSVSDAIDTLNTVLNAMELEGYNANDTKLMDVKAYLQPKTTTKIVTTQETIENCYVEKTFEVSSNVSGAKRIVKDGSISYTYKGYEIEKVAKSTYRCEDLCVSRGTLRDIKLHINTVITYNEQIAIYSEGKFNGTASKQGEEFVGVCEVFDYDICYNEYEKVGTATLFVDVTVTKETEIEVVEEEEAIEAKNVTINLHIPTYKLSDDAEVDENNNYKGVQIAESKCQGTTVYTVPSLGHNIYLGSKTLNLLNSMNSIDACKDVIDTSLVFADAYGWKVGDVVRRDVVFHDGKIYKNVDVEITKITYSTSGVMVTCNILESNEIELTDDMVDSCEVSVNTLDDFIALFGDGNGKTLDYDDDGVVEMRNDAKQKVTVKYYAISRAEHNDIESFLASNDSSTIGYETGVAI